MSAVGSSDRSMPGKFFIRSRVMDFLDRGAVRQRPPDNTLRASFEKVLEDSGCTHIVYVWPGIKPHPFFEGVDVMLTDY